MSDQLTLELSLGDIETLLTSLEYSKLRIREAPDTPYKVRQENLARLDIVGTKLRNARQSAE
jgi:hypothetical protein